MDYQGYVDDHLMCEIEGNHLTAAAILSQDGSFLAQSKNFPQNNPIEINAIINEFYQPGSLSTTGLFLGGVKYTVIGGDPGVVIRGRKATGGVTMKKTNSAMIFGIYDEPIIQMQCNVVVERLGDYLIEKGH